MGNGHGDHGFDLGTAALAVNLLLAHQQLLASSIVFDEDGLVACSFASPRHCITIAATIRLNGWPSTPIYLC
eukprot:COSAG02_NODE_4941_length_4807_cov_1.502124_4_plen_72_part_00